MSRPMTDADYEDVYWIVSGIVEISSDLATEVTMGRDIVNSLGMNGYIVSAQTFFNRDAYLYDCRACGKMTTGNGTGRCGWCMSDDLVRREGG